MYGTIVRYRAKPGQAKVVEEIGERWLRERAPSLPGFVGSYGLRPTGKPDELLALVIFETEADYRQNAEDPEQHRWFEEVRPALAADPEWTDGEIVALEAATVPL
jgi:heme-degrading monooxygenase HmoA